MFNRVRRFLLFLVGVSVPIQGFAFNPGGFAATPFKLAVAVLFGLAALQYAARSGGRPRDRKTLWLLAFVVSFVVATIMAIVAGLPVGPVLRSATTMVALVSFYFLVGYALEGRDDVMLVVWGLVIGGAITVLPGAAQLDVSDPYLAQQERFRGLAGQENLLGADMNVVLAAAAGLFFISKSKVRKAFLIVVGFMALTGIALSLSRSAFLALGTMWAFWLYRAGSRGNIQYAMVAVILGTAALVFMPESVMVRLGTMFDASQRAQDGSIQGRMIINTWAIRAFMSNPLLGVGAPRFAHWVHEQPGTEFVKWHTVHNAYLGVAAEQGLFGLIPYVAVIALSWRDFSACWRAIRARRLLKDPVLMELGNLALFLQLALLSGIVGGLFHQQHRSKTMWLVMALSPVVLAMTRERLEALRGPEAAETSSRVRLREPPGALPARP